MTTELHTDVTIAVFGATGQTGRHVLSHAMAQGHAVRALARDPGKLRSRGDKLTIVRGDFTEDGPLKETVRGATHVICCAGGPYGKGYDTGMMTRFITRLWHILDAEPTVRTFLFQSAFFVPEPDGSNPVILKLLAPVAAYFTGATKMLRDNMAVTTFIASNRDVSFDTIVTRPGKIVDKPGGTPLVASQTPSFAAITFADLGAFTVGAVQDATLHGTHPFVAPKS